MHDQTQRRAAARLTRAAGCVSLDVTAVALSMPVTEMRTHLAGLATRGTCAQRVVEAAKRPVKRCRPCDTADDCEHRTADEARAGLSAVLAHRACPPGMRRSRPEIGGSAAGVAGWHGHLRSADGPCPAFAARSAMNSTDSSSRQGVDLMCAALFHPDCPSAVFTRATDDPNPKIRAFTLSTPHRSRLLTERLASDPDPDVRIETAQMERCPPEVVERLTADPDRYVRVAAAYNPNCTPLVLARLAEDPDPDVRIAAADHYLCPTEVLASLAEDPDQEVRHRVATHARTPRSVLERFANDPDPSMRGAVALNTSCPPRVAKALSRDSDDYVRDSNKILGSGIINRWIGRLIYGFYDRRRTVRMLKRQREDSNSGAPWLT